MQRTIADWMSHAARTADPAERAWCLDEALARASACHEYRAIVAGAAALPGLGRQRWDELLGRALEAARRDREVWGFRDVAQARVAQLDDRRGARDVLEAGVALFQTARAELPGLLARTRGYEWALLGDGFVELLGDLDGLRQCLELGLSAAREAEDADELCDLAVVWAKRLDRGTAVELLRAAEALAKNGSVRPWSLANAWGAVGDEEAARRVLEEALRRAGTTEQALHVARAFGSRANPQGARRALDRARELAKTASHWLELGEAVLDGTHGERRLREALGKAEALAKDPATKERLAGAYRQWLGDEAAASRVGPRGLPPEALRRPLEAAPSGDGGEWEASASGLFDWLRARATPELLQGLAHADYGMDAAKHRAALEDLCSTGLVPRKLAWEPHEVLALARWQSGERTNHVERALACVLLCLSPSEMDELVSNGPILAESCLALGGDALPLGERFFAWLAATEPSAPSHGDVALERSLARLLLLVLRARSTPDDPRLERLAARVVEEPEQDELRAALEGGMRADLWRELLREHLVRLGPTAGRLLAALAG